ncbi:MAG: DUF2793 domain-containing protein [Boseongicola sp.]
MSETANLGLPLVQPAQAQKHVTVNDAFQRLDAFAQISIGSAGATTPPPAPDEGDLHAIGAGASAEWASHDGELALFLNGGWLFIQPSPGWRGWRLDAGSAVSYDGAEWVEGGGAFTPNGAGFVHRSIEVDHDVTAGSTSTENGFIPSNAMVYGVTGRVLTNVGGATSLEIGVAGSSDRYGSGIGVNSGAWARGLTSNPLAYYSPTDLVLTAIGGSFDGSGTIRMAVHFAELNLPRA